VAVVSNMGAPLVGQERLTNPRTIARAVTLMEEYLGQPFLAAALLGLPVVDGDCMGRAFPEAQMTRFAIHGLRMYPPHPRRRPRQRGGGGAGGELDVDGAPVAPRLRRGRLQEGGGGWSTPLPSGSRAEAGLEVIPRTSARLGSSRSRNWLP
jgi:hypothetical protein